MRRHASGPRIALWLLASCIAGQGWAADAWRAEYEIHEGARRHALVVVRDDARVEYRGSDAMPPRIWRRLDDGIERTEVFSGRGAVVVASPGDLRALDELPDWDTLAGIVPPSLRASLRGAGSAQRFGEDATRLAGRDAAGRRVTLEWLDAVGLPADYRVADYRLRLRSLERVAATGAFTAIADLRTYDRADLGDMPLDPFARDYLDRFGKHRHAY
ncbi:hypothetical protein [Luteimonas saliphila]|uniref:hypothetical protein n=1 Tax=Luteimonas saliphila TaxID=2804919 RepID=UPI00192DCF17|nr:hypothetical protein [Luteimonas saliphila]